MDTLPAQRAALADGLAAVQHELDRIEATGSSPDGLVTATVDGHGRVLGLELDPRIYRVTDTSRLAGQILAAIEHASDAAGAQAGRIAQNILGPEGSANPAFDVPRRLLEASR